MSDDKAESEARPTGLNEKLIDFMKKWEHWVFAIGFISVGMVLDRFQQNYIRHIEQTDAHFGQITTNFAQINTRFDQLNNRLGQWNLWLNERYPTNGLIAEFSGSTQPDIHTDNGEELSILSDSAHGGSSLVWYERILHDPSKGLDSDGFLRIHYHLNPKKTPTPVPYVGVFAYFANPPKMFDVSGFNFIQVKARVSPTNISSCEYYFHLFDLSAAIMHNYSWAGFKLDLPIGSASPTNWPSQPCWMQLAALKAHRPPSISIDLTHVFGFAIQIVAPDNKESEGYLDIDDIRFLYAMRSPPP
jgi:hypothetical protein